MAKDAYQAYLERFQREVGTVNVGAYGKFNGKPVRKLSPVEFVTKNDEFTKLDVTYRGILARGDTINDAVVKLWRERRAELIITEPEPGTP